MPDQMKKMKKVLVASQVRRLTSRELIAVQGGKEPGTIDFPNLKITLSEEYAHD